VLEAQQSAFNRAAVGREYDVLIEREGRAPGQMVGRTPYLQALCVREDGVAIGDLVRVRVESVGAHSLSGRIMGRGAGDSPAPRATEA
jgi:tRNA-2-methylthio-N6-dimethylallyladenosine synthase